MEDVLLTLSDVLLPALLALFGAALAYGTAWLRNEAQAIKDERLRQTAIDAIDRAHAETYASVKHVAQTYVDDLKAAREDGKLTEAEKQEALERAVAMFKVRMGQHGLQQLAAIVGDLEEWIISQVEGAVYTLGKSSQNAA